MALSSSSLCLYGAAPVTSFVHAALPPWQSRSWTSLPRRHSRSTTRGRCLVPVAPPSGERTATVTIVSPAMTAQAAEEDKGRYGGEDGESEDEENPNLLKDLREVFLSLTTIFYSSIAAISRRSETVCLVPSHAEMLKWAEETDQRIASGELPPLGSGNGRTPTGSETQPGSNEQAQVTAVSDLLSTMQGEESVLSVDEESTLRAALDKLSASVQARDGESKAAGGDEGGLLGSNTKTTELVPNPIYGSREVRDQVYLYAWSLMKKNQQALEQRNR